MFLVTRYGKPLQYGRFCTEETTGPMALWEGEDVTLFKTEQQAARAITDTFNYPGEYTWKNAEHQIMPTKIYKEKP
jgi:hypothetical protein